MKYLKFIAVFLCFALCLSLASCKKGDIDEQTASPSTITDDVPPFDTDEKNDAENNVPIEKPEQKPQTDTQVKPEKEVQSAKPQQQGDKAEPCILTLQNTFSKYEVIVTLTKSETQKNKSYTAQDFAEYDVFYVIENDRYYGNPSMKDSYPEYQDKTTLFMYLNEPSKENVLKTVKALEKDDRVYAACPCPFNSRGTLIAYLTNEGEEKINKQELGVNDFNIENATSVMHNSGYIKFSFGELLKENQDNTYTSYKKLINNPYIEKVIPDYFDYASDVIISMDIAYYNSKVHTQEFFSKFTEMNITDFKISVDNEYSYNKRIFIYFDKPTYQKLFDMVSAVREYDKNLLAYVDEGDLIVNT